MANGFSPVVGEGGRLAGRAGIADADQLAFGVPRIGVGAIRGEVADGVVGAGLAREHGELVEVVVGGGLGAGRRIDGGGVGGLGDRGDEIFRRAGEGEGRELAGGKPDIGDAG